MLRILIRFTLGCIGAFVLVMLAFTHPWGWSEYASPQLYVVSARATVTQYNPSYFISNATDDSQSDRLTWSHGAITRVGCSPDGQTLAFLTDFPHLYVLTERGLAYDHPVDHPYSDMLVTDDQTVDLYREGTDGLRIDARGASSRVSRRGADADRLRLAPEQLYLATTASEAVTVNDTRTRHTFPLLWNLRFAPPISPDGTKIALSVSLDTGWKVETLDFLHPKPVYMLTGDYNSYLYPICFLTFRPGVLIAPS